MKSLFTNRRISVWRQNDTWRYLFLLACFFVIGGLLTYYVTRSQDTEMRDYLTTYANTIERSIDWRPFENPVASFRGF